MLFLILIFIPGFDKLNSPLPKKPNATFAPDEWLFDQRSYPYGKIDEGAQRNAIRIALQERAASDRAGSQNDWEFAGPVNLGGRVTDIEVPGGTNNTVYLAAASGGIFKSYDRGSNWYPVFNGQSAVAIGDLAISPSDTNVIYAGTGEPNAGGGSLAYDGNGIYKSADGGQTWQNLGLSECGSTGRIAIDPANPSRIFVATMGKLFANNPERGIFRTTDGGNSWEKVLYVSDSTGGIDVVLNPQNPDIIYAALWERIRRPDRRVYGGPTSAIYRSTDGGTTWNKLVNGLPTQELGRISLALCAGTPSVIYASIVRKAGSLIDVYRSTDGGDNWTALNAVSQIYITSYDWWFGGVKVDPVNPDEVYLLMMYAYRSFTGGGGHDWGMIAGSAHVDQHALFLSPTQPQYRILGNDGGVNFTTDNFQTVTGLYQQNLPIGQFYTMDVFPGGNTPNNLIGGLQDNGVAEKSYVPPQEWHLVVEGDGVLSKFDPNDVQIVYGSYQYGGFQFSHPNYGTYSPQGFLTGDRFNWKSPMTIFKPHSGTIFIGSNRVYKSMNYGYTVEPVSDDLTNGAGSPSVVYGTVTAIAVASSDSNYIYAGTDDANLWMTRNGGSTWTKINAGLPRRWVTSIKVADGNREEVFVTFSGYRFNDSIAHVYHSLDGGSSWGSINGNLPDIPVNDILLNSEHPDILYLATDVGVYYTTDTGIHWQLLGSTLPLVPVNELAMHPGSHTLFAATYGRSMYRINIGDITGIKEPLSTNLPLKIYPDPIHDVFNIEFNTSQEQRGMLRIYTLKGALVRTEGPIDIHKGDNRIPFNLRREGSRSLSAGAYIFRLFTGDQERIAKAIIY
jgi:photosystem II stability/assembly factor-like uncharacterized protein